MVWGPVNTFSTPHTHIQPTMTTVLSRTFLALLALASVVAAAPGGGARRSFVGKDGVLDVATRVGVRVTPTDVVENELCSSQQLDSHSWSSNHVRAFNSALVTFADLIQQIAFLSQSDFSNGAACGALIKIGTPGHEQLAIVGGTCIDCKTGSLAVSEALFKTFADLASGQFTAAWAFVGDAPESFEASTDILAQEQASVKTIKLQARAATNVEQALPVFKSAAATSVATLFKRFDNARMTYYDVGLGACGWSNQPSDFVVAINAAQYNSGRYCGQRVQIRANGKTAIAEVVDECPGCEGHGLDLSEALFSHFAPTGKGVFLASWDFVAAHPVRRLRVV
jgi:expansin (peptidoglycan-binding protein)